MDDTTEEQQQRWMPESIFVFAGEGQEPIDIATYLIDDQDIFAALRNTKPRLEFPADLYPPVWSSRKVIESAVKNAVSEADNINLTVLRTMPKTDGGHPSTTLACDMARSYRVPKNANDIQANVYDSNREDLQCIDKLGVRLDHFVNKSQGNRKEGYDQPRRTYTKKPSPEQECPFRIRLMLDPGICWYLKPWSGCRCHLYHTKLPTSEKRRRMNMGGNSKESSASGKKRAPEAGSTSTGEAETSKRVKILPKYIYFLLYTEGGLSEVTSEPEILGVYSSEKRAIQNAKVAFEKKRSGGYYKNGEWTEPKTFVETVDNTESEVDLHDQDPLLFRTTDGEGYWEKISLEKKRLDVPISP
jgi:hypothetical protein